MSGVVRPVVTCSSAVVTPSVPMLADAMPGHPPELADQFDGRGLAVGAGDRDDRLGEGLEEFGGEPGEFAPRLVGGDVDRAFDAGLRPRDHRHRAVRDRLGDEILAVEPGAAEGAEDGARRDLAMIDGEAGDGRRLAAAGQRAELHQCAADAAATGGISSAVSMSRLVSGMTPSRVPARWMTRPTTGAAVKAAVMTPELAGVRSRGVHHDQHHIARRIHRKSRRRRWKRWSGDYIRRRSPSRRCRSCRRRGSRATSARRPVPCKTMRRSNWRMR